MTLTATATAALEPPRWSAALPAQALSSGRQRGVVLAIVALHALTAWALLQRQVVRQVVADSAPLFVQIVAPVATPAAPAAAPLAVPPPALTPPPPVAITPQPVMVLVATAAPAPTPAPTAVVEAPPAVADSAPASAAAPAPAAATAAVTAPQPVAAAGPRNLPPSAVQYLVPPQVEYPRASRRQRETGQAVVRVLIDEAGLPSQVELSRSTGFALLDQAALAAVRKARFKPCIDNGRPQAGWALIPLSFDLDR